MSQYKEFKELGTSTKTVMVYCNVSFNIETLFENLPITIVDVPLTKKKKLPDMKKVKAPKGTLISLRYMNKFRGINTKPNAPEKVSNYFLNQVTCILSLGDKNLHIMVFKDKFKIAGCKEQSQSIEAIQILWKLMNNVEDSTNVREKEYPSFIFDVVMTNVDFKLGLQIDRKKLNNLMNDQKYKDIVHMSRFETTGNTNVNIKLFCEKPKDFFYKCMIIKKDKIVFRKLSENIYAKNKNKKKYTTFLVFRSSKVIESGRYFESMKNGYDFFIDIIKDHKNDVEEKIKVLDNAYVHTENVQKQFQTFNFPELVKNIKQKKTLLSDYPLQLQTFVSKLPKKCTSCNSLWWKSASLKNFDILCGECNESVTDLTDIKDLIAF